MKVTKKLTGLLLIAAMLLGAAKTCQATSTGINATLTKKLASGTYNYGKSGSVIKFEIVYAERHQR